MGAPTGPRVTEHNGGGVMEPDTQPLAGTLILMSKELCMLHQLYIEYIKPEIKKKKHKQNVELNGNNVMFCGV